MILKQSKKAGFFRFGEINTSLFYVFSKKKSFLSHYFLNIKKCNFQPKKMKKIVFEKTQNNDLFISPKRKNAVLEMALKSFILSKLYHEMSKS